MTGEEVKAIRIKLGLTQAKMAEAIGFARWGNVYLCRVENGRGKLSLTAEKLLALLLKQQEESQHEANNGRVDTPIAQ